MRRLDTRFNSCPHAEGNLFLCPKLERMSVSIRALTRRATAGRGLAVVNFKSFNSCPHAEGNVVDNHTPLAGLGFNSCPHAEGNPMSSTQTLRI